VPEPVNVWDFEQLAEEKLDANAHAYFAGGAGDERLRALLSAKPSRLVGTSRGLGLETKPGQIVWNTLDLHPPTPYDFIISRPHRMA
jgi:hypothetical protein